MPCADRFSLRQLRLSTGRAIAVAVLSLLLASCDAAKPLRYTANSEIPTGPGLFTGTSGEAVLLRK